MGSQKVYHFKDSPAPAEGGRQAPNARHEPDVGNLAQGQRNGHRPAGHALDDHLVAIQGDHAHGPDGAAAKGRAQSGVYVAHHGSEHPGLEIQIYAHHGRVGDHDAKVGDGQVDDQQVSGRAQ